MYVTKNQLKDLKVVGPGKEELWGRVSGDCYVSYSPLHNELTC